MSVAKKENIGLFQKIVRLYRGVLSELKKVHWPNKKEISTYTLVVLAAVVVVSAMIWVADTGISFIMSLLI